MRTYFTGLNAKHEREPVTTFALRWLVGDRASALGWFHGS